MDGGSWHFIGDRDQDHPQEKKMQEVKRLSEEALQVAKKRREMKGKGEKERHTHLNAEFLFLKNFKIIEGCSYIFLFLFFFDLFYFIILYWFCHTSTWIRHGCTRVLDFQRIARRDKKAFLSDQCKEIEENDRMGKVRDLFNKIKRYQGNISCKDGQNKGQKWYGPNRSRRY